jgi:hypothetical protein
LLHHDDLQETWRGEIEQLSWQPRAFLIKGFLSDDECDHIIRIVSNSSSSSSSSWKHFMLHGMPPFCS